MPEYRLGDVIDDYCVKCRRLTNHSIVSVIESAAAKVRCRTCYHDHDYRHEQAPPTKKELKKLEEAAAALAAAASNGGAGAPNIMVEHELSAEQSLEPEIAQPAVAAKSKTA